MKKFILFTAALMTALVFTSCAASSNAPDASVDNIALKSDPDELLYDKGLELISSCDEMAESEEYARLMNASEELISLEKELGLQDYSSPKAVYKITNIDVPDEYYGELEGDLKKQVKKRAIYAFPTLISVSLGVDYIAANSIIAANDSFIANGVEEPSVYLYTYEGDNCAVVVFVPDDEDIVSANGTICANDKLNNAGNADEVKAELPDMFDVDACKVEQIK